MDTNKMRMNRIIHILKEKNIPFINDAIRDIEKYLDVNNASINSEYLLKLSIASFNEAKKVLEKIKQDHEKLFDHCYIPRESWESLENTKKTTEQPYMFLVELICLAIADNNF